MRVLITGGTGQVGAALIASAPAWAEVNAPPRAQLDLTRPEMIAHSLAAARADIVVNAAAYTAVDRAEAEPDTARLINADAVAELARHAPRLVQLSTDFVFDGERGRSYAPGDITGPLGVYGHTKLAGETAALTQPGNVVVRTAWVYAAGHANFVGTMLRLMRECDKVRVVADQIGTPTHASGLARAIWTLIAMDVPGGVYHWTDAGVASWYDFAEAIQEEALAMGLLDRAVPIVTIATADYPTAARRPAFSVLDKSATWALTGPARHWQAELRDCLAAWPR